MEQEATDIVIFRVRNVDCAFRRAEIREVLPLPRLSRWPGLPAVVQGFFNLGGRAVPVLDAELLFGLDDEILEERDAEAVIYQHLILVDVPSTFALLVDRVMDLATVQTTQLMPVRDRHTLNGCVGAELDLDGELIHVLEPRHLLLAEEQAVMADLTRQAEQRLKAWEAPA
ncbi:chemotaxis protein CheW [Rhodoligotrophos defluvii]|uniref:chemotaxis protein CheW n=1 Tax=Rhodoligotrophos defluvii TaxID=2561934 RepID=UPI001EF05A59|nr:chemotaxis protein CheW [Rhodoligotrophos defluvii]